MRKFYLGYNISIDFFQMVTSAKFIEDEKDQLEFFAKQVYRIYTSRRIALSNHGCLEKFGFDIAKTMRG